MMRPGQAKQNATGIPVNRDFFQNFSRQLVHGEYNSNVQCCMYGSASRKCLSSDWGGDSDDDEAVVESWDGSESMSLLAGDGEIGMLLDLDEGTLSLYKNGRKLGVMKRGLTGPYCWVVSLSEGVQVAIKRETLPPS